MRRNVVGADKIGTERGDQGISCADIGQCRAGHGNALACELACENSRHATLILSTFAPGVSVTVGYFNIWN